MADVAQMSPLALEQMLCRTLQTTWQCFVQGHPRRGDLDDQMPCKTSEQQSTRSHGLVTHGARLQICTAVMQVSAKAELKMPACQRTTLPPR